MLTLSQQIPLETILENTRLSSFDLIFSKIINFPFLINVNFVEKKKLFAYEQHDLHNKE